MPRGIYEHDLSNLHVQIGAMAKANYGRHRRGFAKEYIGMNRNKPKVLHLTLKAKYFYQILRGEKMIEYREAKPYWIKRLPGRCFDEVRFRNGYRRNAPFMRVQLLYIHEVDGWYEIGLGKVLECILGEGNGENFFCQTWGSEPR